MSNKYMDDSDDPYADEQKENVEEDTSDGEVDVDTDMLPTLLVYKSGDLIYNWVRIDWEVGRSDIEDFLVK
jgi:Phosducin